MSNKIRLLMVCVVALVAVSAIGASSASAISWKINGSALVGSETITPKLLGTGEAILESHLPGVSGAAFTIACKAVTAPEAKIIAPEKSSALEIDFWLCTVTTPATCKIVGGKLKTVKVVNLAEELTTRQYIKFTPEAGTTFTTFAVEGCSAEGTGYEVAGTARCVTLTTAQEVLKGCIFGNTTGNNLKFGKAEKKSATLTGLVGFTLTGANTGKPWGLS